MSKGKKSCYFCGCVLTNQNRSAMFLRNLIGGVGGVKDMQWVDCCHKCKAKEEKKA